MSLTLLAVVLLMMAAGLALADRPGAVAEKHTNRLAGETSPYLLQHAHNPVDWYPWGKEAFERARREDKPIFLSVGYSTCHWCHVMAHESFEDEQVAAVLNEHFVSIKVDREELPDVDEQYMLATQLMTQRGGWPNSVVLTPDGRPWFAGTYYPKDRFIPLLNELSRVWKEQRPKVEEQANRLSEAIRHVATGRGNDERTPPLSPRMVDRAVTTFVGSFDPRHGGFGTRPKFPPHGFLAVLLEQQRRTNNLETLGVITQTLDAMSLGGIYDHIGGGFHRYSTDERWFLPHFEKMLYDNAQLIRLYAQAHQLTGYDDYKRVVEETFQWLQREMTDAQGGFYSAIDADSEGEEGKFYVWTLREVEDIVGQDEAQLFAATYNITREGNYHEEATGHATGANIPYLTRPLPEESTVRQKLADMRGKLLATRNKRIRPHLDDKVLTGWNGLMIAALAVAGREFNEPRYIEAAKNAADFILKHMRHEDGTLYRTWRRGKPKLSAYLDDYAFFIDGMLELHQATAESRYLDAARSLADTMITEFHDSRAGGFYSTSDAHEALLIRAKEIGAGGNIPSGNGVAADVLLRLAVATGEARYADVAAGALKHFAYLMYAQPHGSEALVVALARYLATAEARPELGLVERLRPQKVPSRADAQAGDAPVSVEAFASRSEVAPGAALHIALQVNIEPGYHIYAHDISPATMLRPTSVELAPDSRLRLGAIQWPAARQTVDPVLKSRILTYDGLITILLPVEVPENLADGRHELTLVFRAQACDDSACYPPVEFPMKLGVEVRRGAPVGALRHPEVFRPLGIQ